MLDDVLHHLPGVPDRHELREWGVPVSRPCLVLLWLVACSDGAGDTDATGGDDGDATIPEGRDASVHDDAGTPCEGPNPTTPGDPGSYCVRHLGGGCFDVVEHHVCADGVWQCPEPGMILVRECTSFGPQDVGGRPDFGFDDAESTDAEDTDGGAPDSSGID